MRSTKVPGRTQHFEPWLANTASYFLRGTFNPLDLAAIALGTAAAYLNYPPDTSKGEQACIVQIKT